MWMTNLTSQESQNTLTPLSGINFMLQLGLAFNDVHFFPTGEFTSSSLNDDILAAPVVVIQLL